MSMQSLPTVADSKITPASASFKSTVISSEIASFIDCLFGIRTATTAKTGGNHERPQLQLEMDRTLPQAKQIVDEKLVKVVEAVVEGTKVEEKKLQRNPESSECSKATAIEARTNWLELRERVENVGPRVFAYHDDPKYLQQCEEAKQRRATAAAMCISPSWH